MYTLNILKFCQLYISKAREKKPWWLDIADIYHCIVSEVRNSEAVELGRSGSRLQTFEGLAGAGGAPSKLAY